MGSTMGNPETLEMLKALAEIEKGNYSAAFELLTPLAQSGNPKAQCSLANLYHFGWGVRADGEKAVELYTKVADQGICEGHLSALANQNLATIYVTGLPGIRPNSEKAQFHSKRAKDLGLPMSYP